MERRAFRMAKFATRNQDDALDLVQEAMLKLVQNYGERSESEWGPLFFRILQNRIQDWHRRHWVRNRWRVWFSATGSNEGGPLEYDGIESLADPNASDLVTQVAHKRATVALDQALQELPFRQRQAFLLRAWEGFNVAQTAQAMDCTEGSVKTHYFRAVHSLRERLADHYP